MKKLILLTLLTGLSHNIFSRSFADNGDRSMALITFEATLNSQKNVDLTWSTGTTPNDNLFTIEKSADAVHFEAIRTIDGSESTSTLNYIITDESPMQGISYYRLKQTDLDGNSDYSLIETIDNISLNIDVTVFPNPSTDGTFYLQAADPETEGIVIVLLDSKGQEVHSQIINSFKNETIILINPNKTLPAGIYLLTGTGKNESFRKRLMIR